MSYAERHKLQPGDKLISPIFATGLTKHHSIYLGVDEHGTEWISENHAKQGVRMVTAHDYFSRIKNFQIKAFTGSAEDRDVAIIRAYSELGKPYNLVLHNCEHHSSYVQTGIARSKQVAVVVGTLTILLLIWLLAGDIFNGKFQSQWIPRIYHLRIGGHGADQRDIYAEYL
jgi:hypothetical protein